MTSDQNDPIPGLLPKAKPLPLRFPQPELRMRLERFAKKRGLSLQAAVSVLLDDALTRAGF